MPDGQSIFGVDTARYQPLGTYDPGAFSIVNFEDPQLADKLRTRAAAGIPWGVYLWVYPGHDVGVDAAHMVDTVRGLGLGDPPVGYWFDYEDAGINEGQLHAGFGATDAKGVSAGYYSGPSALDHSQFLDRDWWNAAYPTGAVAFPGYGALWASSRPRPMKLWQYTSAGGLDRDVVVDDAWFAALIHGGTPAPIEEDDVKLYQSPSGIFVVDGLNTVDLAPAEVSAYEFTTGGPPIPIEQVSADILHAVSVRLQSEGVAAVAVAASGFDPAPTKAKLAAARQDLDGAEATLPA